MAVPGERFRRTSRACTEPAEMNPPDSLLQRIPSLGTADAYFCFLRSWWDGAGVDAVVWWRDSSGCFRHLIKTGETIEPVPPKIAEEVPIEPATFEKLLVEVEELGLLKLPQQPERMIYSHYDDWYGLRLAPADGAHWLQIRGGKHADPGALPLLDKVYQLASQLLPR